MDDTVRYRDFHLTTGIFHPSTEPDLSEGGGGVSLKLKEKANTHLYFNPRPPVPVPNPAVCAVSRSSVPGQW
jgi:hypothetical protein